MCNDLNSRIYTCKSIKTAKFTDYIYEIWLYESFCIPLYPLKPRIFGVHPIKT